MAIVIKYILKNCAERKFRTILILFSILCSSALFFASSSLTGTIVDMYENVLRAQLGRTDLVIRAGEAAPSAVFQIQSDPVPAMLFGEVSLQGTYSDSQRLRLRGFDLEDLELLNPVGFRERAGGRDFSGRSIILSRLFADDAGYAVGDMIDLEINGSRRRLLVWGIAHPRGIFRDSPQSDQLTAIIPLDYSRRLAGIQGGVTAAYVVAGEGVDLHELQELLSGRYRRHDVEVPISSEELTAGLNTFIIPFYLMTCMVLFMSIFIIYSTFKVITAERLPVIGTFRSIGADKKMTSRVLLVESCIYGVIGGILGIAAGIGILYIITSILADNPWGGSMDVRIQFGAVQVLMGFGLAVAVSLLSSWVPIRRVAKIPVKELVLNQVEAKGWNKRRKSIAAFAVLLFAITLPVIAPHAFMSAATVMSLLAIFTGVVLAIPFLTGLVLVLTEHLLALIFHNEGRLAAKNLRENKNVLNNITLLTIGIMVLLMINTISYSVGIDVLNAYRDWNFDIMVGVSRADRNTEQSLRAVPGVRGTYAAREQWGSVPLVNHDYSISYLQGADPAGYRDYVSLRVTSSVAEPENAVQHLQTGRFIMTATMMQTALELELGDELILDTPSGERTYIVSGFYDALMANGSNAMIHKRYFRSDMQSSYFDSFFVRVAGSADSELVFSRIQERFRDRGVGGRTIQSMLQMNLESNAQIFTILTGFSVLAMIIGIFGVFNNYAISFLERRRSLAIMRSVGMSRRQTARMLFAEAIAGGLVAGVAGIAGGLLLISGSEQLLQILHIPITIHLSPLHVLAACVGSLIVSVCASITPTLRGTRLHVIEALKYE